MISVSQLSKIVKLNGDLDATKYFFDFLRQMLNHVGVSNKDPRISINPVWNDNVITVNINKRLVFRIGKDNDGIFFVFMIPEKALKFWEEKYAISGGGKFKSPGPDDVLVTVGFEEIRQGIDEAAKNQWLEACKAYLPQQAKSEFRRFHVPELYDLAMNPEKIEKYFNYEGDGDPIRELIEMYKDSLRKGGIQDELYKWRLVQENLGRPKLDARDFATEVKSMKTANLVYFASSAVLNFLATNDPEQLRPCFAYLKDEDQPLRERLVKFPSKIEELYRQYQGKHQHHQDERSMSVYLTFLNPEKYALFKTSFYRKYCKLIEVEPLRKGSKYIHYLKLIDDLADRYLAKDQELLELLASVLPADAYKDPGHRLLAQDILYCMLDKGTADSDDTTDEDTEEISNEEILEKTFDMHINTILYGPPGTGKTYELRKLMEDHFTDQGIQRSEIEVLREKTEKYKLWELNAAVLASATGPLKVSEIADNPLIKAKLEFDQKTKPSAMLWGNLQMHAVDGSTNLDPKYRRPNKLFKKESESRWTISDEYNGEIPELVGEELMGLVRNPKVEPQKSQPQKRYKFITFHQKYGYEDFLEGLKPVLSESDEEGGDLQFELKRGVFYNACLAALRLVGYESFEDCYKDDKTARRRRFEEASTTDQKKYALFIDEINRANMSAVFGELITLLEEDKRIGAENEIWLELPTSNMHFCVPPNLYVIGTMNTADRSIALVDVALRRRFEFKAMYPVYDDNAWWSTKLEALNQAIYNYKKNPDYLIGHAFFINRKESELNEILTNKIIPLLLEYAQNNAEAVRTVLKAAGIELKQTGIRENFQIIPA